MNIPVNYIDEKPLKPQDILLKTYKDKSPAYQLMNDVYILGMVDDKAFEGAKSADISEIKKQEKDYDGILIFGVTLTERENGLLPTRTQLAEVTRAFNREFYYTPVVVIFRYDNFISLASAERLKYKQEWREGEKAGKVSILRDIEIENPHTGHLKILEELKIARSGKKGINSFEGLYQYWQEVFSVNLLNKKFYSELSNWYFWAIKHVKFPSESQYIDDKNQQYKAQNVIRMLTRLLFVWFIKEKKLIPEELFDLEALQKNILKKISPFNEEDSLFKEENRESIYYKAILQNLFFATLNCPVKPDSVDSRERGFRGDESYGKHRGVDYLMRHKKYFKNPDGFLEMVNNVVPFLNGGLFECLDDKDKKIYIDGFSDNMSKTDGVINLLVVPDYLFFGREEKADLSSDYGTKNKGTKEAAVKGLINILKSYKFTIAENTPIEEDVALDPELLGKVFENLLASYNPETKTTARKQTGSFYTPREIVNYMVDESLIAHLKNSVSNWDMEEKELDEQLHKLVSFEPVNPFENNTELSQKIIHSLDNCKILDPACGSGAFPMGILQKMVHILQKVDPDNEYWRKLQLEKAQKATEGVFIIKDKEERKQLLDEINEAFDETINNPDYARKLFLIENCIYGVDIQPIAAQISKLRFFISLVVEQKVNKDKDNFGIRPLPNLETKFVTANTLIGIDKPDGELFYTKEVQEKEAELKAIRHKLFGAKDKRTKVKYRKKDEELRNEIADILKKGNLPVESAEQLAGWDPYDQNGVSPFFDPEWMFDIKDGFDIVIGNPPYLRVQGIREFNPGFADWLSKNYESATGSFDLYAIFTERGVQLSSQNGLVIYIMPVKWTNAAFGKGLREVLLKNKSLTKIISFDEYQVFNASTYTGIQFFQRNSIELLYNQLNTNIYTGNALNNYLTSLSKQDFNMYSLADLNADRFTLTDNSTGKILDQILKHPITLEDVFENIFQGIATSKDSVYFLTNCSLKDELICGFSKELNKLVLIEQGITKPLIKGDQVHKYNILNTANVVIFPYHFKNGKPSLMPEEHISNEFPLAYEYLKQNENVLRNREKGRLRNDPCWFRYIYPKNQEHFEKTKLMAPDVSMGGNFTIDENGEYYSTTTVYGYIKKKEIRESYWYFMALLNSQVLWWYLKNTGAVMANGYFRFKPDYLKPFKIPKPNVTSELELLAKCSYFSDEKATAFDSISKVLNAIVFNLYFPDHMKERKIDVLQFVEKDIEEVMQDNEFETLNDTQKEQVITELHNRWSDPNSEIVKRMSSFSEKSPEILKPIIEL
ncbi:MAG: Eco57I restriction-modification methylase domain-containing protein [Desulfobacterales bacterium]